MHVQGKTLPMHIPLGTPFEIIGYYLLYYLLVNIHLEFPYAKVAH